MENATSIATKTFQGIAPLTFMGIVDLGNFTVGDIFGESYRLEIGKY
jgi:hypothetical protein